MKIRSTYILTGLLPAIICCMSLAGCKKFVEVDDPIDQIPGDEVFVNDASAATAVRGLYARMASGLYVGFGGAIQPALDASADALAVRLSSNQFYEFYTNSIPATNSADQKLWNFCYSAIYNCNTVMENIKTSTGMTASAKILYTAEARFIRALNFFYLVNLYGEVPLPTTSNYETNSLLARSPVSNVYDLIKEDLLYAEANLGTEYQGTTRLRANTYVASALLAKVYLYLQDWDNAITEAGKVINNTTDYALETDLDKVFLLTSPEAILRFHQPGSLNYTYVAYAFLSASTPNFPITDTLLNTFETGDLRKTSWTLEKGGYATPYKYKVQSGTGTPTESHIFLRLSDIYLIRAEARAQNDDLENAIADLDAVRGRAQISLIADVNPGISQEELLNTIAHERWVELFAENGDRWLDLKRTGKADEVLKDKPNWETTRQLYPIPQDDRTYNPYLTQNKGYE